MTDTVMHKAGRTRDKVLCGLDRFDEDGKIVQPATMFDAAVTCHGCLTVLRDQDMQAVAAVSAEMQDIVAKLADLGAQFVPGDPHEDLVTIPLADWEALEIQETQGAPGYTLVHRKWELDGVPTSEKEVATAPGEFVAMVARGLVEQYAGDAAAVAYAMTPTSERPVSKLFELLRVANDGGAGTASQETFEQLLAAFSVVAGVPEQQVLAALEEEDPVRRRPWPDEDHAAAAPFSPQRVGGVWAMLVQADQQRRRDPEQEPVWEALFLAWVVLSGEEQHEIAYRLGELHAGPQGR
ncbi:hypothetical protein [Actinomadura violacea]|uniref:Uncharacterized protein n=1 Tax=Actinomadura violacea TaxID=2819934 RepID=A0ABS3RY90_9ACTN|nr:hypothetical protein [Actinomadura violacea]MBO2461728.1 hypothetical protein [Actinomadura violacea]